MRSLIIAAIMAISAPAVAQEFPTTPAEHYEVGQTFANCSAYFNYGAGVARSAGLEDSAVAIEGMERGWTLAGMFILLDGLDLSRQTETQETFLNMQQIKVDQLKAQREMGRATGNDDPEAWIAAYQAECGPWLDLQKAIIQAMRSAPNN
ncbi:hypothetical protein [Brevundimonas sp. TWP1-2-1b1]|uniref:hypothetical protein n=1 Tax=unclassified Brevundimonas TaxID=2622653 RepID=UPI003CF6D55F